VKRILIQAPDGLKPYIKDLANELEREGYEVFIWIGSCYGPCDIPNLPRDLIDVVINLGHLPSRDR